MEGGGGCVYSCAGECGSKTRPAAASRARRIRMQQRCALLRRQPIDFVEHVELRPVAHTEVLENLVHRVIELGMVGIRDVAYMQDQRGFLNLLERRAKGCQQSLRQPTNEAYPFHYHHPAVA